MSEDDTKLTLDLRLDGLDGLLDTLDGDDGPLLPEEFGPGSFADPAGSSSPLGMMPPPHNPRDFVGPHVPLPTPTPGGPGGSASGRGPAEQLDPVFRKIEETLERFAQGLLTATEAEERLKRAVAGDAGKDAIRDVVGPGVDPAKFVEDLLDANIKARGAKDDRVVDLKGSERAPVNVKPVSGPGGLPVIDPKSTTGLMAGLNKLLAGGGSAGSIVGAGVQVAGTSMFGGAAANLAAGPYGAAAAAAASTLDMVSDKVAGTIKGWQESVHLAGDAAKSLAGNDGLGIATAATEKYAKTVE